ncbi:MAG: hypothetical protein ACP5IA_06165 [Sediminispirochaetaceae bacterium]
MFGEEKCYFLTAGMTSIELLAGEVVKVGVAAVAVAATSVGYTLSVIVTAEKVFADSLDPLEMELPVCTGIFILVETAEIKKTPI